MSNMIKLGILAKQDEPLLSFDAENFGEAVVCQGHAALREVVEITVNDAPGQCWGEYIHAEAGSYDCAECRTIDRDMCWCIDDEGAKVELITVKELFPMRLDYKLYVGCGPLRHKEKSGKHRYKYIANFRTRPIKDEKGKLEICCVEDDRELILIPGYFAGNKVKRVDLTGCKLGNCHTLIVDANVEELIVDFYDAYRLERIEIGSSTNIIGGPGFINFTPWFKNQPKGPVYLSGWYCGSNGDVDMGQSKLVLRDDCIGAAPNADRHSYWKKIVFPPSVKTIGSFAFSCMPCLEELEFSEGLESVGDTVFWNCSRLQELDLPDSLAKMGTHSFDLMQCLKRACLHSRSYRDDEFFLSYCDEIVIRDKPKGGVKIRPRPWPSKKKNGQLTAYAKGRTLYVSGRCYRSPAQLTAEHIGESFSLDYLDIYGNKVRFLDFYDSSLIDSKGKYHNEKLWYVQDGNGITQISRERQNRVIMVHEGLDYEDVPPRFREYVADLFGVEYKG